MLNYARMYIYGYIANTFWEYSGFAKRRSKILCFFHYYCQKIYIIFVVGYMHVCGKAHIMLLLMEIMEKGGELKRRGIRKGKFF